MRACTWPKVPLKYLVSKIGSGKTPKGGAEVYTTTGVMLLRSQNVHFDGLRLDDVVFIDEGMDEDMSSTRVQPNDVLLNITGASIGRCTAVPPVFGAANVNQHVCIIRPNPDRLLPEFLNLVLQSPAIQNEIRCGEHGSSREGLNFEQVAAFEIPMPPLSQQATCVERAQASVQRVEQLIGEKQRLLDLLTEKRRALIANAVTRGLNPNVPMRDSGIDWLGKLPASWEVKRAKLLFREIDERSTSGDEVLLSLRMEKGLVPHNDVSEKLVPAQDLIGYKKAWCQQIVVNRMRAASGLIAVVPQDGIVSPDYAVFEPKEQVNPAFFALLFQTPLLQSVFRSESKGLGTGESGFLRLYSENFLSLRLPVPPSKEQKSIVDQVHHEVMKLSALATATNQTLRLLKERRNALVGEVIAQTSIKAKI